jgi:hypothetical protein
MLTKLDYEILEKIEGGLGCLSSELDTIDNGKTKRRYRLSRLDYCWYKRFGNLPFEPMLWKLTAKGTATLAIHRQGR